MNSIACLNDTILHCIEVLEKGRKTIVVVVDENDCLCGTVTDGDIRRGILNGSALSAAISTIMNKKPIVVRETVGKNEVLNLMNDYKLEAIPVVSASGKVLNIYHIQDFSEGPRCEGERQCFSAAIIMAGGEGVRLRPLTNDTPKPLLKVGGVPIIERQVLRLERQGVRNVFISINYLGEKIKGHLGDGSKFGVKIQYLEEIEKLGTAGAVSLLPSKPFSDTLVINGDVLTNVDYASLFNFHKEQEALITMAATSYNVEIPYGVVRTEGVNAIELHEKPSQHFLCNAGIYALAPKVFDFIPKNKFYNMTELIDHCLKSSLKVAVFPVHEYWTDIGTRHEYDKARSLFGKKGL